MLRVVVRHPFLILVNFVAAALAAVALGLVYRDTGKDTGGIQNRLGALFFVLLYFAFMALSSLPVWREEGLLFVRERAAGAYGTAAYFTAVVLFDVLPMRVLPPAFFAAVSYPMIGLHPACAGCGLAFWLVLVMANVTGAAMCMAIGAAAPSNAVANVAGSLATLVAALFGGPFINRAAAPAAARALMALSYVNYAYEALMANEFHGVEGFRFTSRADPNASIEVTGDEVLGTFGFEGGHLLGDVARLGALGAGMFLAAFLLLKVGSGVRASERTNKKGGGGSRA